MDAACRGSPRAAGAEGHSHQCSPHKRSSGIGAHLLETPRLALGPAGRGRGRDTSPVGHECGCREKKNCMRRCRTMFSVTLKYKSYLCNLLSPSLLLLYVTPLQTLKIVFLEPYPPTGISNISGNTSQVGTLRPPLNSKIYKSRPDRFHLCEERGTEHLIGHRTHVRVSHKKLAATLLHRNSFLPAWSRDRRWWGTGAAGCGRGQGRRREGRSPS